MEKEKGKVATMLRRTPKQVVDDRRSSGSHQTTIEAARYVAELRSCFNDVLARMEPDEEIRSKIDEYDMHHEDQRGPIFSNKLALENIQSKSPRKYYI